MINELDRQEEMGDGYANEFQRAAAWSAMQPKEDDSALIAWVIAAGHCAVVELTPHHCRVTDAIIGEHAHLWFSDPSRQVCLEKGMPTEAQHDPDGRVEIWPHEQVPAPATAPSTDEIPF